MKIGNENLNKTLDTFFNANATNGLVVKDQSTETGLRATKGTLDNELFNAIGAERLQNGSLLGKFAKWLCGKETVASYLEAISDRSTLSTLNQAIQNGTRETLGTLAGDAYQEAMKTFTNARQVTPEAVNNFMDRMTALHSEKASEWRAAAENFLSETAFNDKLKNMSPGIAKAALARIDQIENKTPLPRLTAFEAKASTREVESFCNEYSKAIAHYEDQIEILKGRESELSAKDPDLVVKKTSIAEEISDLESQMDILKAVVKSKLESLGTERFERGTDGSVASPKVATWEGGHSPDLEARPQGSQLGPSMERWMETESQNIRFDSTVSVGEAAAPESGTGKTKLSFTESISDLKEMLEDSWNKKEIDTSIPARTIRNIADEMKWGSRFESDKAGVADNIAAVEEILSSPFMMSLDEIKADKNVIKQELEGVVDKEYLALTAAHDNITSQMHRSATNSPETYVTLQGNIPEIEKALSKKEENLSPEQHDRIAELHAVKQDLELVEAYGILKESLESGLGWCEKDLAKINAQSGS